MKNLIHIKRAALIVTMIAAITSCKHTEKPKDGSNKISYEPAATFPDYEKTALNNYTTNEPRLDEGGAQKAVARVLAYAGASDKFNLKEPIKDGGKLWYKNPADPSAALNINLENGDINLNTGMRAYAGNESTKDLLKKDEAGKMALNHLSKLSLAGNTQNEYVMAHIGGLNVGVHENNGDTKVYEKFTTVRFDRKLGEIPVEGHSRIIIQMAEGGKLTGLTKHWASFKGVRVEPAAMVAPDGLKSAFEQHMLSENTDATRIVVKKITLVYYDQGHGLIEPAIRAECETYYKTSKTDTTTRMFPYDIIEPILKSPRQTYSFMHDKFRGAKMKADDGKDQQQIPKGADEGRKDTTRYNR
jgi:hypothetical protein